MEIKLSESEMLELGLIPMVDIGGGIIDILKRKVSTLFNILDDLSEYHKTIFFETLTAEQVQIESEKLRKNLSQNIKKRRKRLGLSQEKFAQTVELSPQTINDIEGCRMWVSDKTMVKFAKVFQIESYQLLTPLEFSETVTPATYKEQLFKMGNLLHEIDKSLYGNRLTKMFNTGA